MFTAAVDRFPLTGSAFEDALNSMPHTARDPAMELRDIMLRSRPREWDDQLGPAQDNLLHEVNSLGDWVLHAAAFREEVERIPVIAVATYRRDQDDDQLDLDYVMVGTATCRVAVLNMRKINDHEGGGLPQGLRVPGDIRDWLHSPHVMVLSVGNLKHLENLDFMSKISAHVDAGKLFRRFQKHHVIKPVSPRAGPGDVDWLLAWAHTYHPLACSEEEWRCLVGPHGYGIWPRTRSQDFPITEPRGGDLSIYGRFRFYFTTLAPHVFGEHVLYLALVEGSLAEEEQGLPLPRLYPRFLSRWGKLHFKSAYEQDHDPAEYFTRREFWEVPLTPAPAETVHSSTLPFKASATPDGSNCPGSPQAGLMASVTHSDSNCPWSAQAGLMSAITDDAQARAAGCLDAWSRLVSAVKKFDRAMLKESHDR